MRFDLAHSSSALAAIHGDVGARPGSLHDNRNNNASLPQAGD